MITKPLPAQTAPDTVRPAPWRPVVVVGVLEAAVLLGVAITFWVNPVPTVHEWVSNLALTAFAFFAAGSCFVAAMRSSGVSRTGWRVMTVATGGWAVGNAIWSYYELLGGRQVPFPSLADLGYLTLPAAAIAGQIGYAFRGGKRVLRWMLDSGAVVTSMLVVGSVTVLPFLVTPDAGWFDTTVGLAYPVLDALIVTFVILFRPFTAPVAILGAGLVFMGASDTVFAYQTAIGAYHTGTFVDMGWMIGMALFALAPVVSRTRRLGLPDLGEMFEPTVSSHIPVASVAIAWAFALNASVSGRGSDLVLYLLGALTAIVLLRQWLALLENRRLIERLEEEERLLRHMAIHDSLTGLPNRAGLIAHVQADPTAARTLAMIDLDDFKTVNDTFGHEAGDRVLQAVARRLRARVRPGDFLARLGGDEFAVVLHGAHHLSVEDLASRLVDAIQEPLPDEFIPRLRATVGVAMPAAQDVLEDASRHVRASIGVVEGTKLLGFSDVLRFADIALYEAKNAGGGRHAVFDTSMAEAVVDRATLTADLGTAIQRDELVLHYQPIVNLRSGSVTWTEALVRWRHPTRGLLAPDVFIPLAERSGLILDVGRWTLTEATRAAKAWTDRRPDALPVGVSVNISAVELRDPRFFDVVRGALDKSGLDPELLCIELTETAVMADIEGARAVLTALRALGVSIAVDDFGTGYASLTYLRRLPVTSVKIDRSFTDGLGEEVEDTMIVSAVIGLSSQLNLDVIAEGVETSEQLALLSDMGCSNAQGYLLSKPVAEAALLPLLDLKWLDSFAFYLEPVHSDPENGVAFDRGSDSSVYRVLIADDDENDRVLLRYALGKSGRFEVVAEARDGAAAVELAAARQPHVAIMDLQMPKLDGLAALPRILMAAPGVKIVFLSGHVTPKAVDRALALGAVAFFKKGGPNLADELLRALDASGKGGNRRGA